MSKFYGTVSGAAATEATRRGHDYIRVSAQSWDGSLITRMRYDREDQLVVQLDRNDSSSSCSGRTIFYGTMDELESRLKQQEINVTSDAYVAVFDVLSCLLNRYDDGAITSDQLRSLLCSLRDKMASKIE